MKTDFEFDKQDRGRASTSRELPDLTGFKKNMTDESDGLCTERTGTF